MIYLWLISIPIQYYLFRWMVKKVYKEAGMTWGWNEVGGAAVMSLIPLVPLIIAGILLLTSLKKSPPKWL